MNGKPPKTLPEWIEYLHAARAIPSSSPDYSDAQEAVRFALQRIQTLNAVANAGDQAAAEQGKSIGRDPITRTKVALGAGLLHNLGGMSGEPIAGVIDALTGGSFREGAGRYRQGLENIGNQASTALPIGEMLGMSALAAMPVSQGVAGGTKIAQAATQGARGPNMLARVFLGAAPTNVAPGAALGAVQGFSAGGADPGDVRARLKGGAIGAGVGAATQAAFGGLGALRVPRWLKSVKQEIHSSVPAGTAPALVDEVTTAAWRAGLKHDYPMMDEAAIDRGIATARPGKHLVPAPTPPPTVRPGETITPTPRPVDMTPSPPIAPDPLTEPTALRTGKVVSQRPNLGRVTRPAPESPAPPIEQPYVAKSYKELRALVGKGIPREQIRIGGSYYTRGGRLQQSITHLQT